MKLIAVAALVGGLVAAPLAALGSGTASASPATPSTCDGVGCVPYVKRGVQAGERCNQSMRFNFGLDASGATMVCNSKSMWISWSPLIGVRTLRSACTEPSTAAQTPDGYMLSCINGVWTADNSATFYR
ncbi:hypothetical protein CRI77_06375 [Mycolicibacterium duvalii]|uniref:Uncharacterized protein n=1 Tax=Mycolicibacterium duvalii TaxID=39688 RepID=A0A7I7K8H1_9MYCO|nr:hypothetical protein [Mycolicibacterium duvalii]MCV7368148.1 hypothetical protein [Mycolicibacterium duvalii]PEG43363.1 hypothetical protein CRI77_06375 [Mycolicibacterium duvalii]BBX19801.1 hypothetical protein MDUV_46610 [Mycolicibacterium duvalii]